MLLKRLKVLGVGCNNEINIVVESLCVNLCKFFIMLKVVELFNLVEILFMKSIFIGLIIILFERLIK